MKIFGKLNLRLRRAPAVIIPQGRFIGRRKTRDVSQSSIQFRMPGGFSGAVNRAHPMCIVPYMNDPTNPVPFFGSAVQVNGPAGTVRGITTADESGTAIFGIAVRPFPTQQPQANADFAPATFGVAAPQVNSAIDILKSGMIMVPVVGTPVLGGQVYVWAAATGGGHTQGGFEASAPAGNGLALALPLTGTYFNGGPDANGIAEVAFNI